jgi:hypothetical protein
MDLYPDVSMGIGISVDVIQFFLFCASTLVAGI